MDIQIQLASPEQRKALPVFDKNLGFGKYFSNHMFVMEYDGTQWTNARIMPYEDFRLPPSTMCLHYGQGIFEGLKAYKNPAQEKIYLFRPEKNMERMNRSAQRMVMPTFDGELVIQAMQQLIMVDQEWIPTERGYSYYLRPTMIGIDPILGIHPSSRYIFYVIGGPVGSYYPDGLKPVDIYVSDQYVRAVVGGIGEAKTMGNYAASLYAQIEGKKQGCNQVLWLDGVERRYIEEVGAMNIFVRFNDELVTPALSGSILPGVTRASVLTLAADLGIKVTERKIAIDEVMTRIESGEVLEMFGSGTAAVISPVGSLVYKGKRAVINHGEIGTLSQELYDYLTKMQVGELPDKFNMVREVNQVAYNPALLLKKNLNSAPLNARA